MFVDDADSEIQERGLWNVQPPDTGLEFSLVVALTADRVSGLQEFRLRQITFLLRPLLHI